MSSDPLEELIQTGYDLYTVKYYALGTSAILFYDYLLTLGDEVRYAWSGRKSWVFALFITNRYLPLGYQAWLMIVYYGLPYSQRMYDHIFIISSGQTFHTFYRCDGTALASVLVYVGCTVLAQVVLTLRIYAITAKNRIITAFFGVITVAQLVLGGYFVALAAVSGAQEIPSILVGPRRVCIPVRRRSVELGFPAISLVYDLLAFLLVIYVTSRSHMRRFRIPSLFRTIAQDATRYFVVIFTSHLALELALIFGRPSIQLLPATGVVVFLPVMITRLMLSLKKASASRRDIWSFGEPAATSGLRFIRSRGFDGARDGIRLDTFKGGLEGAQNRT